jgi:PKD repeat protein
MLQLRSEIRMLACNMHFKMTYEMSDIRGLSFRAEWRIAAVVLALIVVAGGPAPLLAEFDSYESYESTTPPSAESLYETAREYRRAGQPDEVALQLRKVLIIDPAHEGARRELEEVERELGIERAGAMDSALAEMQQQLRKPEVTSELRAATPGMHPADREELARALDRRVPPQLGAVHQGEVAQLWAIHTDARRLVLGAAPGRRSPARIVTAMSDRGAPYGVPAGGAPDRDAAARWQGPTVRAPDEVINGVRWFYLFGSEGQPRYGALADAHVTYIEVPRNAETSVLIRVLDADINGKYDEKEGRWDTSTSFRVFSGDKQLDAAEVGPDEPDGTVLEFGPYVFDEGQRQGDHAVFRIEAEGLDGDDTNLFAFEIAPPTSQVYTFQPAIRLAKRKGSLMQFFPAIPPGTTHLTESNYDPEAGVDLLTLTRRTPDGRAVDRVALDGSMTEGWSSTGVDVPSGTDNARWTYNIEKASTGDANMAFRMDNQQGRPVPIYTTPIGAESDLAEQRERRRGRKWWWPFGRDRSQVRQGEGEAGERLLPSRGDREGMDDTAEADARMDAEARRGTRGGLAPAIAGGGIGQCNTFTFDASSSYDPDNDELVFVWDFGDGAAGEGVRTTHTYEKAGAYHVVLVVTDNSTTPCGVSRAEQVLHVNTAPTAVFEAPSSACAGTGVRFNATTSSDTPGEALTYRWDFGDGTTAEGAEITHAFASGGNFLVQLTVDDGRGTSCSTDAASMSVKVNSPPTVTVEPEAAICAASGEPLEVVVSAVGSNDPDVDTLTYRWDFGDGTTGDGAWASHVYPRGGTYTAAVTVDDGSGTECATATKTVSVRVNRAPQVVVPPIVNGCMAEPVSFNAGGSTDPDGDTLAVTWDFGDGDVGQGATAQHTYAKNGDYAVQVTADDGSGMSCGVVTSSLTADINAPPVARMLIHGEDAKPAAASPDAPQTESQTEPQTEFP